MFVFRKKREKRRAHEEMVYSFSPNEQRQSAPPIGFETRTFRFNLVASTRAGEDKSDFTSERVRGKERRGDSKAASLSRVD